ncbi:hypothetical protein BTVI_57994 [Pitangus sulphuratus]|nr:hypothetical protein BTVI_57994 [Pitangus sulphuratus]
MDSGVFCPSAQPFQGWDHGSRTKLACSPAAGRAQAFCKAYRNCQFLRVIGKGGYNREKKNILKIFLKLTVSPDSRAVLALGFSSSSEAKHIPFAAEATEVEIKFLLWKLEFRLELKELGQFTPKDLTCGLLLLYYFSHGGFMFPVGFGLVDVC